MHLTGYGRMTIVRRRRLILSHGGRLKLIRIWCLDRRLRRWVNCLDDCVFQPVGIGSELLEQLLLGICGQPGRGGIEQTCGRADPNTGPQRRADTIADILRCRSEGRFDSCFEFGRQGSGGLDGHLAVRIAHKFGQLTAGSRYQTRFEFGTVDLLQQMLNRAPRRRHDCRRQAVDLVALHLSEPLCFGGAFLLRRSAGGRADLRSLFLRGHACLRPKGIQFLFQTFASFVNVLLELPGVGQFARRILRLLELLGLPLLQRPAHRMKREPADDSRQD